MHRRSTDDAHDDEAPLDGEEDLTVDGDQEAALRKADAWT